MKKYIVKTIVFLLCFCALNFFVLLLSPVPYLNKLIAVGFGCADYTNEWTGETRSAISRLRAKPQAEKAILGDSVAGQLFASLNSENPEYCISNGNAAFLLIGQWVMLNAYLEDHPNAQEVFLVLRPTSLGERMNTHYSYQFVVVPFYNDEYSSLLLPSTIEEIKRLYPEVSRSAQFMAWFQKSYLLRYITLNFLLDQTEYTAENAVSEEAGEYLEKMFELCEEKDVKLYVLACPMADTDENRMLEQNIREALEERGLLEKMPYYFDSLLYYPQELLSDGIHFKSVEDVRSEVISHYQVVTGKMGDIVY